MPFMGGVFAFDFRSDYDLAIDIGVASEISSSGWISVELGEFARTALAWEMRLNR